MVTSQTSFLLTVSMLKGVGPATLRKLASIPNFHEQDIWELAKRVPQLARSLNQESWNQARGGATEQIDEAFKINARILSALDPEYPKLLASTKDDPFLLFVRGKLAEDADKSVAVIGTREPTGHGEMIAARITSFFAEQGWSIVSGLAIGCDAIAHQTALDCRAHTVAVLAHGLHTIAPTRHRRLAEEIVERGGALVSEYRFGQDAQKQQFVKRDKTQAGLAKGVVMIQSDLIGGSLHASRASLEYGRWLAIPYPTDKDRDRGEAKVQANLVIADGTNAEVMDLLRCPHEALGRVIILRGRDNYTELLLPDPKSNRGPYSTPLQNNGSFESPADLEIATVSGRAILSEELTARQRYVAVKMREIDALMDCLAEASSEAKWELLFELENAVAQMLIFTLEGERELKNLSPGPQDVLADSQKVTKDLREFRNQLAHGEWRFLRSESIESENDRVAASKHLRQIRGDFQAFASRVIRLLRDN